jgi:large subunit ribosomal protein L7Ae
MSQSGKKGASKTQAAGKADPPKAAAPAKAKAPGAKKGVQKSKKPNMKTLPIWEKRPRNFGIGGNIQHKRDLTRFVRWPKYVRLQRQKSILLKRLKVPGTINQFTRAVDRNTAASLFQFLEKYRPETKKAKQARLLAAAKVDVKATKGDQAAQAAKPKSEVAVKAKVVKYGLNNVTSLVESKKAQLVIIAHDVDPLELVLWLPTLCRKKDVPYLIVKGKSRLGKVVHKKNAAVLAVTSINEADKKALELLVQKARDNFLSRYGELVRQTGGQVMGSKHIQAKTKEAKRAKRTVAK